MKCQQNIKILKVQRLDILSSNTNGMLWHDLLKPSDSQDQEESLDSEADVRIDALGRKDGQEVESKEQKVLDAQNAK